MSFKSQLVDRAIAEWIRFGRDLGSAEKFIDAAGHTTTTSGQGQRRKETVEAFASRIADYWLVIPAVSYNKLVKDYASGLGKLDGTINIAWSAAFISYCMQMAGAGIKFPYASGHVVWINKSIANRQAGKTSAALVGYRPGERPLAIGDLVGKPRTAGITYENSVSTGWYESHSDIIVEIDLGRRLAFAIGGNVGHSVGKTEVPLTENGHMSAGGSWHVHIVNNIEA